MPWVRLDDRFPSHRKVALLSDRAFRLYVSALCWSSENLTEGLIHDRELAVVTRIRGAKTAAKELEEAQLWDRVAGGWQIHDFLEYNPDRARVKAEREANAARQQAWRDRKRAEKEAQKAAEEAMRNGVRNAMRNGVTDGPTEPRNESSEGKTLHDGDTNAKRSDRTNQSSPQVSEIRNGVSNGTPSPSPSPASPKEKPASNAASPATTGPQIPDFARDLVDQMTTAGMIVGWRLSEPEWFAVHAHIKRSSTEALVEFARRRWNPADPPQTARYLTRIWSDMPNIPADADGSTPPLRAIPGSYQPFQLPEDDSDYANGF